MEFITALVSFLVFGLMFCTIEYIIINYFLSDDDYEIAAFMVPLTLTLAIFSLVFVVGEFLQQGVSYSQLGYGVISLIGLCFSAIAIFSVAWYNNNHCFTS